MVTKPVSKSHLFDSLLQIVSGMNRKDRGSAPAWQRKSAPVEPAPAPVVRKDLKRVLIAEDNPINQEVAALMLEHLGYEVLVVASGLEAVAALDSERFTLILMDCQMPEMDGFTAAATIRDRKDDQRQVPIIAMTANAMKGDRERCIAAGMDDYIAKPIDPKELAKTMARWSRPDARERKAEAEAQAAQAGETDIVALLARHFAETEQTLLALRAALSRHDAGETKKLCDVLRGRSEELGAARMMELVGEVAAGVVSASNAMLGELEREFQRVRTEFAVPPQPVMPSA